jgi:hypothetical protein
VHGSSYDIHGLQEMFVVRSLDEIVKAGGTLGYENSSCKLASKYYRMMVMEMGMFGNFSKIEDQKNYFGNEKSLATTQMLSQDKIIRIQNSR